MSPSTRCCAQHMRQYTSSSGFQALPKRGTMASSTNRLRSSPSPTALPRFDFVIKPAGCHLDFATSGFGSFQMRLVIVSCRCRWVDADQVLVRGDVGDEAAE